MVTAQFPPGAYYGLKDLATGQTVPCQQEAGTLSFLARNVPAMGYRTYVPGPRTLPGASLAPREEDASLRSATNTLENSFFRLRLDPARGVVASLVDKRSGRELVDAASEYGLGQYVYERFDADEAAAYVKAYCRSTVGLGVPGFRQVEPAARQRRPARYGLARQLPVER